MHMCPEYSLKKVISETVFHGYPINGGYSMSDRVFTDLYSAER